MCSFLFDDDFHCLVASLHDVYSLLRSGKSSAVQVVVFHIVSIERRDWVVDAGCGIIYADGEFCSTICRAVEL